MHKKLSYFLTEISNWRPNLHSKPRIFYLKHKNVSNIGDNINGELLSKIMKRDFHRSIYLETYIFKTFFLIGSILRFAKKNSVVLGSGFNNKSDINSLKCLPQIKFVRGYLSASLLADKFGVDTNNIKALGDAGLLVSDYYPRAILVENKVLLILNHADRLNSHQEEFCNINNIDIFNMGQRILFVDFFLLLTSYKLVITSALHGVIFCDSFSIKCIPVRLQNSKVSEFKFHDYFSIASNRNACIVNPIDDILELSKINLLENFTLPPLNNLEQRKIGINKAILESFFCNIEN